jgi:Mg-chelatase subunit ChlD
MSIRRIFTLVAVSTVLLWSVAAYAKTSKDYLVVVDTSYSMSGSGGQNIIDSVKSSVNDFIDKDVSADDSITLVTFDTQVKFYPTVTVTGKNDRDIIKKYYSMIEAKGSWTYTLEMVKEVLARADQMQNANKDRQVVVMVLTDSLDDPPPAKKKDRLSIKDIAEAHKGSASFIYFINLGDAKQNARLQKLAGNLKSASAKVAVVDVKDNKTGEAIKNVETSVESDLAKKDRRLLIAKILIIAAIILALLLLLAFLRIKFGQLKLAGILEYRYILSPYKEYDQFDIGRLGEKRVAIGKGTEFRINLRDYNEKIPVIIEATRFDKAVRPAVKEAESATVEFLNNKKTSFLTDGDSFKAGGYIFIYRENKESK